MSESLRSRLANGETVLGTIQIIDSVMVSELLGVAGLDFIVYDQEHGPLTAETTLKLAAGAQYRDVAPVVRIRENRPAEIQRALDIGAAGVQIPQVETRAQAEDAARAARFSPDGERGLSQYVRAGEYWGHDDYTDRQNRESLVVAQVEGEEGVSNIQDIVSVEGIDVIFVGPYDLSQSLGIPGKVTDPRVESLMNEICEKVISEGKIVGTFSDSPTIANQWIDAGVKYITLGVDASVFASHIAELRDQIVLK